MSVNATSAINLDRFDNAFYRDALNRCVREHADHYGERLEAMYVWGSVHRNEAVPGVSNIQLAAFIRDGYGDADRAWDAMANPTLRGSIPGFYGIPFAHPLEETLLRGARELRGDGAGTGETVERLWRGEKVEARDLERVRARAWLDRLRYDATLIAGRDVTAGLEGPLPDRAWAWASFLSVWDQVREAAGLAPPMPWMKEHQRDFRFRDGVALRRRQIARLAVLGGAYLLMGEGAFRSFRGCEVLPHLRARYARWSEFLDRTESIYATLTCAGESELSDYLASAVPWVDWIGEQLRSA